jgi:hypothetical protein
MLACHTPMMETEGEEGIYASTTISDTGDHARDQPLTVEPKSSCESSLFEGSLFEATISSTSDDDFFYETLFGPQNASWDDCEKRKTDDERQSTNALINDILTESPPLSKSRQLLSKPLEIAAEAHQVYPLPEIFYNAKVQQLSDPEASTTPFDFLHPITPQLHSPLLPVNNILAVSYNDGNFATAHIQKPSSPGSGIEREGEQVIDVSHSSTYAPSHEVSTETIYYSDDGNEGEIQAEFEEELEAELVAELDRQHEARLSQGIDLQVQLEYQQKEERRGDSGQKASPSTCRQIEETNLEPDPVANKSQETSARKRKLVDDGSWKPNRLSTPSRSRPKVRCTSSMKCFDANSIQCTTPRKQNGQKRVKLEILKPTSENAIESAEVSTEDALWQPKVFFESMNPFTFDDEQRLAICLMIVAKHPTVSTDPLALYYNVSADKLRRIAGIASPFVHAVETATFEKFPTMPATSLSQGTLKTPSQIIATSASTSTFHGLTIDKEVSDFKGGFSAWEDCHINKDNRQVGIVEAPRGRLTEDFRAKYGNEILAELKEKLRAELEAELQLQNEEQLRAKLKEQLRKDLKDEIRAGLLAPPEDFSGDPLLVPETERLAKIAMILRVHPKAVKKDLAKEYNVSYDKVLRLK